MIGMVVAGHGNFATGMGSNIELIAGQQENFILCDFIQGMTAEDLSGDYMKALNKLSGLDGIVFFTDIPGGTPFNEAVKIKLQHNNVSVLTGSNIPMLLDMLFNRDLNMSAFMEKALDAGKKGIMQFETKKRVEIDDDGI